MKLTAEDYKHHYQELSDAELLAIESADLVDIARRCYDAELTRRHITPEATPTVEPDPDTLAGAPEIDPEESLVQVGVVTDFNSAMYIQKLLQDAAIPCVMSNEPTHPASYAAGTICVSVPVSCAESARELLAGTLGRDNQVLVRRWFEKDWTPGEMELKEFIVTIDDLFGEESKVAVRFTVEGVNPRTGRDVKFGGLAIVHVTDGKIAQTWINLDS
jgi:hypothetical protein